ncbi:MAG TPA: gluconate 2-dehydrogenase subunit 3 family protein [Steroidobacteraceae bacterium]|nr:gluconate 2-dehydrogenase subunit 3 family protein [Steroidobacteraceae bacterium]
MDRRQFIEQLAGLAGAMPGLALLPGLEALAHEAHARARTTTGLRSLDVDQDAIVTRIADILLPQTDTIGASAVGVNRFVDLLLSESMLDTQRQRFLAGLAAIDARCRERHGAAFAASSAALQEALVRELDQHLPAPSTNPAELAARERAPMTAETGYAQLKALTVLGYFTSAAVTRLMNVPVIPGRFDGCVHL